MLSEEIPPKDSFFANSGMMLPSTAGLGNKLAKSINPDDDGCGLLDELLLAVEYNACNCILSKEKSTFIFCAFLPFLRGLPTGLELMQIKNQGK